MTSKKDEIIIKLGEHGGPVYAGRPKGEKVRNKYSLNDADRNNVQVIVIIPEDTYTINSSFFLGLFGDSVRHAGSKLKFLEQYTFKGPEIFTPKIDDYIKRALHERMPLV